MKFFCKLVMGESGDFPGAPDTDTWEITESDYDHLREQMKLWSLKAEVRKIRQEPLA